MSRPTAEGADVGAPGSGTGTVAADGSEGPLTPAAATAASASAASGQPPMLRARGVRKSFGSLEVLKGIDMDVGTGEVVVLLGPSGSGKSTFLRCINHLEAPDGGSIRVAGELIGYREHKGRVHHLRPREVTRQRRDIGMVFQHFNLFPHQTVLQNVIEAPVGVRRRPKAEAQERAHELLRRVGLSEKAGSYPRQLSGGQQQRVAIARALAMQPKLMLFDEPTSALDPELVGEVLETMRDLVRDGLTMVVVTHEIAFAREAADRVVFMDEGRVLESGPPSVLDRPSNPRTQAFLKRFL
ncbi:ATP-binding protein [Streptomyces daqingensis]|uniref:ATP-binding protein n=2 Tax=Streptomyces daqingensis TaxID=1472640 RepID=A0ABQ2MDL7_9ACTN|nr:ATP-binding protein [Streptomyces daqingensis]